MKLNPSCLTMHSLASTPEITNGAGLRPQDIIGQEVKTLTILGVLNQSGHSPALFVISVVGRFWNRVESYSISG